VLHAAAADRFPAALAALDGAVVVSDAPAPAGPLVLGKVG
jgi:hypothetical protein